MFFLFRFVSFRFVSLFQTVEVLNLLELIILHHYQYEMLEQKGGNK